MTNKKSLSCSFSLQLIGLTILSELLFLLLVWGSARFHGLLAGLLVIIFPPAISIIPYRFLRNKQPESADKKIIISTLSIGCFLGIILYPCGFFLLWNHSLKVIWKWIIISIFRYFFNTGLFFSSYNLFHREENRWLYLMLGFWIIDFMIYWLFTIFMLAGFST